MEEDTEYLKLPVEERVVHKLWKARLNGYEEVTKLFRQMDDEKSPEFSKYLGLVKKFVIDSNAVAQEKGLEAVLAFVESYALAGKTVGEVMSGIVNKCIAAPKTKTKELAVQVTLMYVEIEKQDIVQEELIKGMEAKNPKISSACVSCMTQALREFGSKIITIKPLVKKISSLLEDRDKTVREEGKAMVIEMYRWVGVTLSPQLNSLKPVQLTELETEFSKVSKDRAVATRFVRSQQQRQAKMVVDGGGDTEGLADEADGECEPQVDPYDLMDPVDILSQLPKDFYEKVEAKKWQERKETLDLLETLLQAPKLETGDYGDLVRALKKIISKDSNVVVVTVAGKCMAALANGLKKRFSPYASACIPSILEKFKEKKQTVVTALKEAIDAMYPSTTIEGMQEDVVAALDSKNPSVKSETASFLARCFTHCTPTMLNKKILKVYSTVLLKMLNDPDPTVRENAAEALGTAMKVVGEKAMSPLLADVENIKLTKIKECSERAVIVAKVASRPASAPAKIDAKGGSVAPKPVKRPVTGMAKKGPPKKAATRNAAAVTGGNKTKGPSRQIERELTPEEVDEKAAEVFAEETLAGLADTNWKTRLSAVEQFIQVVSGLERDEMNTQVLLRTINKKPGLKDTNFQVQKLRLESVKIVAEAAQPISSIAVESILPDIAVTLGDPKNGSLAGETLTVLAEATKLDVVATVVLDFAFNQKSPKVQQETLNWLATAITEFGFCVQPKALMDNIRKAVGATNPTVRNAGIALTGVLYLYMGQQLSSFFESEKPALQQLIFSEFEKHEGETPPCPIRGGATSERASPTPSDDMGAANINIHDLMPHTDISHLITDQLITDFKDKNWKVRQEALTKVDTILNDNKLITNDLGELPSALALRLVDSNGKIAACAFTICQALGLALGSQGKLHLRILFPAFLQGLGDSKATIRTAALACINTWGEQVGFKELFDGEMIADGLKTGSPQMRTELWPWLTEVLPTLPHKAAPKDELLAILPHLFTNLEDRNPEVRKNCLESVTPIMVHLGYEPMVKAAEKLKPGSRGVVQVMLDKARAYLPARPAAPSKNKKAEAPKINTSTITRPASSKNTISKKSVVTGKPTARRKDDEADTSPLLQLNSTKNQRSLDEQKLKILKWNFTTPRDEFVELLREQMQIANINKSLIANMFHADFKYHLKAIEALSEDLPINGPATVANLDLILKWMTLRFFDTNPSVLLKGLEYLQTVFAMLIDENYHMFENEASSFLPYLILKIGDPKDAVRNGVKSLFKQMQRVYPASKLFLYLMDGLKSKNARQRTECLEQLGSLIESFGMSVCQPTASAALREIARQISDRDNSVRNAALNCVVQVFYLEGEKVYKMVGQISDKDSSLLEERIKRAAKNRPAARVVIPPVTSRQQPQSAGLSEPDVEMETRAGPSRSPSPPPPPPVTRLTIDLNTTTVISEKHPRPLKSAHLPSFTRRQETSNLTSIQYVNCATATTIESDECDFFESSPPLTENFIRGRPSLDSSVMSIIEECSFEEAQIMPDEPMSTAHAIVGDFTPEEVTADDTVSTAHAIVDDFTLGEMFSPVRVDPKSHTLHGILWNVTTSTPVEDKTAVVKPRPASGPFGLDFELLERIEGNGIDIHAPKLAEFDLKEFLNDSPCQIPSNTRIGYPTLSPPKPLQPMNRLATCTSTEKAVDTVIKGIASPDLTLAIECMIQMDALLTTDKAPVLVNKVDSLVLACVMQLRLLNQKNTVTTPLDQLSKGYRTLLMLIMAFYKNPGLSERVGKEPLRDLVDHLLRLLVDERVEELDSGESFVKVINVVVVRIIEKSDHTTIACALIKSLHECVANGNTPPRFLELVMKCLWKVIKLLPSWESRLAFNVLLKDIHCFFKDFPSVMWKKRATADMPLRTVKTILHTMVKLKGNRILLELDQVDNSQESELESYLVKLIKAVKQEPSHPLPPKREKRLSKNTHELLSEIFRKIGTKAETNEGLQALYDFKTSHPEADIEPFLAKSSTFFQQYIEEGMRSIELSRKTQAEVETVYVNQGCVASSQSTEEDEGDDKDAQYYLMKLRSWQQQAGIEETNNILFEDNTQADDNRNNQCNEQQIIQPEVVPVKAPPTVSNIDLLRQRLDKVKGSSKMT